MTTKFYGYSTTPSNEKPIASLAFSNIDALIGAIIQLDGRKSYDPERQSLTFTWKFKQIPSGSLLTNSSFRPVRPGGTAVSFIPDKLGIYVVELIVNDGELDSDPADCIVNVQLSQVPIGEGKVPDAKFLWKYISDFWNLVEDRAYITSIWSSVIQLIGAETIKVWSNDYNKSLKTIQNSVQRRWQKIPTTIDVLEETQRIIVGRNASGSDGTTGVPGEVPGTDMTPSFYVPYASSDFTLMEQNYGAKGRIAVINSKGYSISRVYNKDVGVNTYSCIVADDASLIPGMVGVKWRIPQLLHIPGHDLESEGISTGDVIVFEVKRRDAGYTAELRAQVVGVDGDKVGFEFTLNDLTTTTETTSRDQFIQLVRDLRIASQSESDFDAATRVEALIGFMPTGINLASRPFSRFRITMRAKKFIRNNVVQIAKEAVSVPALQESLYEPDVILRENLDYTIESGFLTFATGIFTPADVAPEIFWAETIFYDNSGVIENNFGRLVELSKDDLTAKATRAPYLSAVKGLFFAMTGGPTIANIRLGLQILLGLPFSEETSLILEIEEDYSEDTDGNSLSRMLVEDIDKHGRRLGIRRTYFYPTVVGLEINTQTGMLYKANDIILQWAPVCKGVDVQDYVRTPMWWKYALRGLEILKFFTFRVTISSDVFDTNDVKFAYEFVKKIKPAYTRVLIAAVQRLSEDIEVVEENVRKGTITFYDDLMGLEAMERLDDASSQGFVLRNGGRPFSTRSLFILRDIITSEDAGQVIATSSGGNWDINLLRARIEDAYTDAPVREGDILAIAPGQPGASLTEWGLYEIGEVRLSGELVLTNIAAPSDPESYDYASVDPDTFIYGENLIGSIIRREVNPILVEADLDLSDSNNLATSATAKFRTNGVGVDDHLIVESGMNKGEYRIDKVPAESTITPNISETQVALLSLDGSTPIFTTGVSNPFRIIRHYLMSNVILNATTKFLLGRRIVEVLDSVTADPLDVFTPGLVGTVINISDSDNPANNGAFVVEEYLNCGTIDVGAGTGTDDSDPTAVVHLNSMWHSGFEVANELRPFEAVIAKLVGI